jgi:hypothetical protein
MGMWTSNGVVPMFASTNIRKHEVQKKKAFVYEDL